MKILTIIITLFASQGRALTLDGGPLGLGAHAMGMAGAVVALPSGAESMFWNPAGLSEVQAPESFASYGSGGNFGPQDAALGLGMGLPGWGSLGLAAEDERFPGDGALHVDSYILGAALPITSNIWLGTNQKFLTADPGALAGWSMDLGLQAALVKDLRLGLDITDAVSDLNWGSGLQEVQPSTFQGGLAWSPFYGAWLDAQYDWIDRQDSASGQWRGGLESAWFGRALILRAGATQVSGSDEFFATAGLGSSFQVGTVSCQLDYAYVTSTSPDSLSGSRQLLSLSMRFGVKTPEASHASISKVLKDPRTGKIYRAKIDLVAQDDDVKDWQLQITNKKGKVIRSFKGRGALPPSLTWDGKSDQGALADADGLSYNLRTTSHSGQESKKRALLSAGGPVASSLGTVDDSTEGSDSFGLREGGTAKKKAMRVKPSLKGTSDFQLKGAEFDLSDVAQDNVNNWQLRIVDAQGKVVKQFSGRGKPPKSIKWEGSGDLGNTVDSGLGDSYVLRVEDNKGKTVESGDDLVSADDFSRIAQSRPLPSSGGSKKLAFSRKDGHGGYICEIPFGHGTANLGDDSWRAVEEAVALLNGIDVSSVDIRGYVKKGEADDTTALSQARAETVLKAIIEGYDLKPDGISAKGYGDSSSRSEVEVLIHNRTQTRN